MGLQRERGLAALVLYEQPALVGRALTIRVTRGRRRAPPRRRAPRRALLRLRLYDDGVRALYTRRDALRLQPPTTHARTCRRCLRAATRGRAADATADALHGRRGARCAAYPRPGRGAALVWRQEVGAARRCVRRAAAAARSLRVVGEAHAVAADANGTAAVLRCSAPRLAPGLPRALRRRRLRAVELHAGIGRTGRTRSSRRQTSACSTPPPPLDGAARWRGCGASTIARAARPGDDDHAARRRGGGRRERERRRRQNALEGCGVATPSLDALRFAAERVRAGAAVAAVALYRKLRYAGERLIRAAAR